MPEHFALSFQINSWLSEGSRETGTDTASTLDLCFALFTLALPVVGGRVSANLLRIAALILLPLENKWIRGLGYC